MTERLRDTITLDSILDEVEQVRQLALEQGDYKAALSCTLSKAKLMGGGDGLENKESRRIDPLGLKMIGDW